MADYRIICTRQEPASLPNDRAHIVAVGTTVTNDASRYSRFWQLNEVLAAIDVGHTFHTLGLTSGKRAEVRKYNCPFCTRTHIRSNPDAVTDNNLDNLPTCG
jgi:hypothetical protein